MSGIHPGVVRIVRVVGSGKKRRGCGAPIVHRPLIRIGSAWQLSSTKRGTGRKRKTRR